MYLEGLSPRPAGYSVLVCESELSLSLQKVLMKVIYLYGQHSE